MKIFEIGISTEIDFFFRFSKNGESEMNALFTGHEADMAATEGGNVQGEFVTLHVKQR